MRWAYEGVHLRALRRRPPVARLVVRRRRPDRRARSSAAAADRADVRLRRHQRHGQDEQLAAAGSRPRPTRWRSWSRRCCAGSTPAAGPTSPSTIAFDRRDPAAVRRVGHARRARSPTVRRSRRTSPRTPGPTATAGGVLPATPRPLPYRTLASVVDITTGDEEQTLRILSRPRPRPAGRARWTSCARGSTCAQHWVNTQVPAEDRTHRARPSRTPSCSAPWTSGRASRCGCWPRA